MASGNVKEGAHWRDSARNVRFFMLDGTTAFPMLLFLMHIKAWTFYLAISFTIFFVILRHYGYTLPVFARIIRGWIAGPYKQAMPWWEKNDN